MLGGPLGVGWELEGAGRYEWLLDCNRRMHALLVDRGYEVVYEEYSGGHNYPSWRDRVGRGLEALLGG
jgi:enterochelin esterase family protein